MSSYLGHVSKFYGFIGYSQNPQTKIDKVLVQHTITLANS